ncbi:hypothetical protein AQS8620_02462 [Aquimixticola soesokkakensis]|uniref:Hedgehog/Intein (Hint) domain-containing protein n=1 Tax=Aquimixticola soesokkakensis TaxID=1519096 RepID=A0A1Y5TA90_9RHOB|nr:Hint domain-containing protein [Aquimixticola soesokkakensis]SLN55870.1 hypothetical protein AQS8620_02462 [Aquimixticola soesokkakensis]
MAQQTISIFATSGVSITRDLDGKTPQNGNVITNALNGNAFSWERPSDLTIKISGPTTSITFEDADGVLTDDPFSGSSVIDQRLTQAVTLDGVTYTPNAETTRWKFPAPVNVENEYEVTLYDGAGTAYRMVGVSITTGYTTKVVGVMFDGAQPPAGTVLHYIQGVSTYAGSGQSLVIPTAAVCFLAGTLIETPTGPVAIEDLQAGMLVQTLGKGAQPIRWIGRSTVCGLGTLAPVRFAAGAIGNNRDLFLSPNHRVLLQSPLAELNYGESDVLVPAKALVNGTTVARVPQRRADYLHLMLDSHEMVFCEGIASESLFSGDIALGVLCAEALAEIQAIFPQLHTHPMRFGHLGLTMSQAQHLARLNNYGGVHL